MYESYQLPDTTSELSWASVRKRSNEVAARDWQWQTRALNTNGGGGILQKFTNMLRKPTAVGALPVFNAGKIQRPGFIDKGDSIQRPGFIRN